jgi:putative hemin transport protein
MNEQTADQRTSRDAGRDASEDASIDTCWTGDLREQKRSIYQRELSARLEVTEVDLAPAQIGVRAVRLQPSWQALIHGLGSVGPVVSLSGNDHAMLQGTAHYRAIETRGSTANISCGNTDLCLFLSEWQTGLALTAEGPGGPSRSLEFFDAAGRSVHKVLLGAQSDVAAFEALVDAHASEDQSSPRNLRPTVSERLSSKTLAGGADSDTAKLEETLPVIQRIGTVREPGSTDPIWSRRVSTASFRLVLDSAIESKLPLLLSVGNHGVLQMHTGLIHCRDEIDGLLNLRGPQFNLYVDDAGVAGAWVVGKQTSDGTVTSLELYDGGAEMVVSLMRI